MNQLSIPDSINRASAGLNIKLHAILASVPLRLYAFHFSALFVLYQVFSLTGLTGTMPGTIPLLNWDAGWYLSIMKSGYVYKAGQQCNLAFYPLFPLIWRCLHLSPMCMSIVNLTFMLSGLTLIRQCIYIPSRMLLLILSVPSLFFCYVPYSEAIFFFSCSLFLYGWKYNIARWTFIGLAMACVSRSASPVFLPVIVISFILNYKRNTLMKSIGKTFLLLCTTIGTLLIVQVIQYSDTGYWFKFFEVQSQWGRIFNLPRLFFTTWGQWHWIWLDGLAFFIGAVSLSAISYLSWRKFKNHSKSINPIVLFSLGYLMMTMVVVVFWGPADTINFGTSVYSLNRFVFATPFFAVFLSTITRYIRFEYRSILAFLIIADVIGFMFGAFSSIHAFIYWAIAGSYAFLYLWLGYSRFDREIWTGLYLVNSIFQLWMFNSFLQGGGVL